MNSSLETWGNDIKSTVYNFSIVKEKGYAIICNGAVPLVTKGVMPMNYVTWSDLFQFLIFIVALVGLIYQILKK